MPVKARHITPPGFANSGPQGFEHPEPQGGRPRIRPFFLPFAGCPARCSFCNQWAVTGQGPKSLQALHDELDARLAADARPMELAFYGGTFTALPEPWPRRFLELARRHRALGAVTRVRCSTRPDAVGPRTLDMLRELGLDLVELGVQSFSDASLAACNRGCDAAAILDACRRVRGAGLALGLQLMPGLPGQDRRGFLRDVELAAAQEPECVRLYPCQVLRGTRLERDWSAGAYAPWNLEETVDALGEALDLLWSAGIRVIRMGLPPEPGLAEQVLAGPVHPALGQLARSEALFRHLRGRILALGRPPRALSAPARYRSDLVGHGRRMLPRYEALGLGEDKLIFTDDERFLLD